MVHVARLLLRVDANQYGNTPGNEERRNAANRLKLSNLNPALAHLLTAACNIGRRFSPGHTEPSISRMLQGP